MKRKREEGDEPLSEAALRVLVLGDGNLSYSLGLAQRLPNACVLATSYDDAEAVRSKYTGSNAILARLEELGPRVRVLHGVDALDIHRSLTQLPEEDMKALKEQGKDPFIFHHVVFNHPHTGWEDIHRHTALLAHFLDSCKAMLRPLSNGGTSGEEPSQVHVTLAGDQAKRWRLFEAAQRLGFTLRHICDFYRQFGPYPLPSQIKRHQSGKSFRLRGLPSFTYTFTLGAGGGEGVATDLFSPASPEILWRHSYSAADHETAMGMCSGGGIATRNPITDVVRTYKCEVCAKCFRGPKDLRNHMYNAHENVLDDDADSEVDEWDALRCEPCDRRFKDTVALEQHRHAKHSGRYQGLKPDWSIAAKAAAAVRKNDDTKKVDDAAATALDEAASTNKEATTTPAGTSLHFKGIGKAEFETAEPNTYGVVVLCPVCDYYVPESGVAHLADLRPPERPTFVCEGCERTFREERALKQHANFCWAVK